MTEITPRTIFVGVIVFTMFLVGGISLINMFDTEYADFADSDQLKEFQTFNRTSDLIETTNTFNESITSLTESLEEENPFFKTFGIVGALFQGAWGVIGGLGDSLSFMLRAITGLNMFGVPSWFIGLSVLLIFSIILFTIFSVIFNRKT